MAARRYWRGDKPAACEICGLPFTDSMVDGRHRNGPWALMCVPCFDENGRGYGVGRGQKYVKQADGQWLKTEG